MPSTPGRQTRDVGGNHSGGGGTRDRQQQQQHSPQQYRQVSFSRSPPQNKRAQQRQLQYPTSVGAVHDYVPMWGVACFLAMAVGLGVWEHYMTAMVKGFDSGLWHLGARERLDMATTMGRAQISTGVVLLLGGLALLGAGLYRAQDECDQDLEGRLSDTARVFLWLLYALQAMWWLIMSWVVVLIAADVYMIAAAWVVHRGLSSTVAYKEACSAILSCRSPPPEAVRLAVAPCPAECFLIGYEGLLTAVGEAPRPCVCDGPTLVDARDAMATAMDAIAGVLAGAFTMYIFGQALHHWLSTMMGRVQKEVQIGRVIDEEAA